MSDANEAFEVIHRGVIFELLSKSVEPLDVDTIADKTGIGVQRAAALLASMVYGGGVLVSKREEVCHECGHGRGADLVYSLNPFMCGECGEYWPCSDSKRTDILPTLRARHYAKRMK